MRRFDEAAAGLVMGETVRITVTGHEPWGVTAVVQGFEAVGASVDAVVIDSPSGAPRALPGEYPPIGTETDAVVQGIRRTWPPAWLRLTLRAADLIQFHSTCTLCGFPAILSPNGDGLTVDVRSADGPGATSFGVHRACLTEQLHPAAASEHARVATLGRPMPGKDGSN